MYFSRSSSSFALVCNAFGACPASARASPQRSQICGYHSDIFTPVAFSNACLPGGCPPLSFARRFISATICCLSTAFLSWAATPAHSTKLIWAQRSLVQINLVEGRKSRDDFGDSFRGGVLLNRLDYLEDDIALDNEKAEASLL